MKKLLKIYQNFSKGKQIAVGVVFIHLTLLFMLSFHHLFTSRLNRQRPMIVKTILPVVASVQVKEKPASVSAPAPAPAKKKSTAAPKLQNEPQKVAAPKPAKKVQHPLSEVAKSLETFSTNTQKKVPSTLTVPKKIEPAVRKEEIVDDVRYEEILIAFLQESLDLPEFGPVRLKLEIDGFGLLIDCQIVEAKSAKNAEFLKNKLPELSFPCLNDFGKISATQTFNITFRNVETR